MMRTGSTILILALGMIGCSGSSPSNPSTAIATSANASGMSIQAFPSGPLIPSGETVHVHILAAGQDLFTDSGMNCLHDPFTPGVYEIDVVPDANGAISFSFAFSDMSSAVDHSCALNSNARLGQLNHLAIQLSIPADSQNCTALCGTKMDCSDSCVTGNRKITWGVSYKHADLVRLDLAAQNGMAAVTLNPRFDSLGIPIAQTGSLPDLIVDGDAAANTWHVTNESFEASDCAVVEGCAAAGKRTLLRFDGSFINAGSGDFVLGNPQSNPRFTYSACHNHYHLEGIMFYQLLTPGTMTPVASATGRAVGRKEGFCVEDGNQIAGFSPPKYDCTNQGLTSGWEDAYDESLDCQWIDVTGVAPGNYILRITVNPDGSFPEADTSNNSAEIPVTIPAQTY